jgi:hypothetical protein
LHDSTSLPVGLDFRQGSRARNSPTLIRLLHQPLQGASSLGAEFPGLDRVIGVRVRRLEALLDDGEILVLRQGAVMVRVCNGELLGAETALQFARVERAVVVPFKPVKSPAAAAFVSARSIVPS